MKKFVSVMLSMALLLSLCIFSVNAIERVGDNGKVLIEWDADAADKITFDGDISEWSANGYKYTTIDADNMYAWSGAAELAKSGFAINAYFVADSNYLYVAFFVEDSDFVKCIGDQTTGAYNNADAIQMAIDYNGFIEHTLDNCIADYGNNKPIFYSFACYENGDDLVFQKQESYDDRPLSEANGDGVKGAASECTDGWCAEFAISWEQMYQDFAIKTLEYDYIVPFNAENDFKLGILLCYLDHSNVDNNKDGTPDRLWMAGTTKSDSCEWLPTDSGIYLTLEWAEDRHLSVATIDSAPGTTTDTEVVNPPANPPVQFPDKTYWEYSEYDKLYIDNTVRTPNGGTYNTQAQKILPGKSVATKFTVTSGALASVNIYCPSWNDSRGTLALDVYEWIDGVGETEKAILTDGYAKTVASTPIASETFVNFADNSTLSLYLEEYDLPVGGTYLVVLSNPDSVDYKVGYSKSTFVARDYYAARNEDVKYALPTDADIKAAGYDPQYSTNVIAFDSAGAPQFGNHLNLYIDLLVPPEDFVPETETDTGDFETSWYDPESESYWYDPESESYWYESESESYWYETESDPYWYESDPYWETTGYKPIDTESPEVESWWCGLETAAPEAPSGSYYEPESTEPESTCGGLMTSWYESESTEPESTCGGLMTSWFESESTEPESTCGGLMTSWYESESTEPESICGGDTTAELEADDDDDNNDLKNESDETTKSGDGGITITLSGCSSSIGGGFALASLLSLAAIAVIKKKKE